MSFIKLNPLDVEEVLGSFSYDGVLIHICTEPTNMRLGDQKLTKEAQKILARDLRNKEGFLFANAGLNHFKIIFKSEQGIDLIEKKLLSGKFRIPQVKSMKLSDLMKYIDGEKQLH